MAEPQSQCFCLFLGVVYSGIQYIVHYIVLNQSDFENQKKFHFEPEKGYFWFTLRGQHFNLYS
jgi:hypothetical protein